MLRELINSKFPIKDAYYLATGHVAPSGKCFCPFHDNRRTPAAKVYQKRLVCFGACNRSYDSYDLLLHFRPDIISQLKQTPLEASQSKGMTSSPLLPLRGLSLSQVINTLLSCM